MAGESLLILNPHPIQLKHQQRPDRQASKPRKPPTIEALTVKPDGEEPLFRINTERKVNSPRAYSFKERIPIPRTLLSYLAALSVRGSLLYS
ncbi:hypothetical protein FXO38_35139 [Capsicum annuum]|nr:hypothetical protein FXO38_35139 [Capsicum annuum]